MRTTISLSDELYEDLKVYAKANGITFNRAANTLIQQALHPSPPLEFEMINGFPVIKAPAGARSITTEDVIRWIHEEEDAEIMAAIHPPRRAGARRAKLGK